MIHLEVIDWKNYRQCCSLKISEKQKSNHSVAPNVAILARTYAYRNEGSCAYSIYNDNEMIGLLMYRDWGEPPKSYVLDQFMIDERFQGKGYGKALLNEVEKHFKKEQVKEITLCAYSPNYFTPGVDLKYEKALAFFERNGYVRGLDAVSMQKDLFTYNIPEKTQKYDRAVEGRRNKF